MLAYHHFPLDDLRYLFFFQAEDGIRYLTVTGVQTCALPILQETVGKLWDQKPSEPAAKWGASGRGIAQPLVRALNCEDEVEPESSGLTLVELRCRNEVVLCLG